jgi:hypothetical protein
MISSTFHGARDDLPDAGEGMCCDGAAIYGPHRCTCWTPVFDLEQQPLKIGLPLPPVPVRMCEPGPDGEDGCAYRPGSPERSGDESYAGGDGELDRLVATGTPFYCHRGIRRPVAWRHPSGAEIPGHPGDYDPPVEGGVPYKADGTPADICAGWLWRRAKVVAAQEQSGAAS